MGGKSQSSSSSNTSNYDIASTVADYSQGAGNRSNVSVSGTGNTVLDGGAIKESFSFADKQSERAQMAVAASLAATQSLAARQSQNDADTVDKVLALTEGVTTGGAANLTKWIIGMIVAIAGIAGAVLVLGGKAAKAKG